MLFVIKHVLPDGKTAGYHADSCCTIVKKKEDAKVYEAATKKEIAKQIRIVRENFEFIWNLKSNKRGAPKYGNCRVWKGYPLEKIKTVAEVIKQ